MRYGKPAVRPVTYLTWHTYTIQLGVRQGLSQVCVFTFCVNDMRGAGPEEGTFDHVGVTLKILGRDDG